MPCINQIVHVKRSDCASRNGEYYFMVNIISFEQNNFYQQSNDFLTDARSKKVLTNSKIIKWTMLSIAASYITNTTTADFNTRAWPVS